VPIGRSIRTSFRYGVTAAHLGLNRSTQVLFWSRYMSDGGPSLTAATGVVRGCSGTPELEPAVNLTESLICRLNTRDALRDLIIFEGSQGEFRTSVTPKPLLRPRA
jgi:hypothetical protein